MLIIVVSRRDLIPPGVLKDPLSGTSWEAKHAQCYCSIFRLCGKADHASVGVPKFLTERRLTAAPAGLSTNIVKELGSVEAVTTAVLGDLVIVVKLVRKPRLLTENTSPVITLSRRKWAARLPARHGSQ